MTTTRSGWSPSHPALACNGDIADPAAVAHATSRVETGVGPAVYPGMRARRFGGIINLASQVAYQGMKGLTHDGAAKAGIVGFTRALALEGAPHGATVNAIAPGPTDTDILPGMSPEWRARKMAELPIGRFATPAEIAPTALLLASDDGAFHGGQTLSPNGGDVML
jgi:3-oxoacyl-[acyl-carrier protein] reductase